MGHIVPGVSARTVRAETAELDGLPVRWLEAPCDDPPILWVHGVPDSADVWRPFLARAGGIAVDLPGFGASGKPAEWPYGAEGFLAFLERFLDARGVDRVRVVAHDWGSPALLLGERIAAAVAIDVVPLIEGHTWHRFARLWRTRGLGELAMGLTSRRTLRWLGQLSNSHAAEVMTHFDHGTQRAILRLHRGADSAALARLGRRLENLRAPTLIVWGEDDPYLAPEWAARLAEALPGEPRVLRIAGAGHWPWQERPDAIEQICAFLEKTAQSSPQHPA